MAHARNGFEIPVADMDRAVRFYEALTGHSLKREAFGGPGLSRIEAARGHLALPKVTLQDGMGCFAHIIDSEGNRSGLHAQA